MTINPQAYKSAIYPPMLQRQEDQPDKPDVPPGFRRFILHWNSSKVRGKTGHPKNEWQQCQGVLYSDHNALSRVALSNGQHFATQTEMEDVLRIGGDYRVQFIDD